jgi:hypothetical protein
MGEMALAHPVVCFPAADDGLERGSALEPLFDAPGEAALLARDIAFPPLFWPYRQLSESSLSEEQNHGNRPQSICKGIGQNPAKPCKTKSSAKQKATAFQRTISSSRTAKQSRTSLRPLDCLSALAMMRAALGFLIHFCNGGCCQLSIFRAAIKASWGISTFPNCRIFFLPAFCFSKSLRLRVMSPP